MNIVSRAFEGLVNKDPLMLSDIVQALCKGLDIPYYGDRDEKFLGHRRLKVPLPPGSKINGGNADDEEVEGPVLPEMEFRLKDGGIVRVKEWKDVPWGQDIEQLTREVWTRDHYPDSFNDIAEAVDKFQHGIIGAYFHKGSLNVVLLGPMGEKVGIRMTSFHVKNRSMFMERVEPLTRLRKAATA